LVLGADGLLLGTDGLVFGVDGLVFGADGLLFWVWGRRVVVLGSGPTDCWRDGTFPGAGVLTFLRIDD
jgi:hypothetical protein